MGSIPIARSTLEATPGHVGLQDWRQHIDPMGKSWEIDAQREEVSLPHVSLHCPGIHTYSHTQKFSKMNCVNSHAPLIARVIAGGWTRPTADKHQRPLSYPLITPTQSRDHYSV